MSAYPSTENLYERDEETHKLTGKLKRTDFGQVDRWLVTEKVDGTNIRLLLQLALPWLPGVYDVRGRTDKAALPPDFIDVAVPSIDYDRMAQALGAIDEPGKAGAMVVYGEGYGPGIQKGGGAYGPRKALRVFDVVTYLVDPETGQYSRGLWRTFPDVELVAEMLDLETVPVFGMWTAGDALDFVRSEPYSRVAVEDREVVEYEDVADLPVMEGVVARTDPYLYDYRGNRLIWKLKGRDLPD